MVLKAYNLSIETPQKSETDTSKDVIKFGVGNNYPQEVLKSIYESPTASALLSTRARFISGDGCGDKELSKFNVNPDQTVDELITVLSESLAYQYGFALNVKYTPQGKIKAIYSMPFEACRLPIPKNNEVQALKFNLNYGRNDFKENETETYDLFDPNKVAEQLIRDGLNYKGQVLYVRILKPGEYFYPYRWSQRDLRVFQTESGIVDFHKSNVDSNFLLSTLIQVIGDPEEDVEIGRDKDGNAITKKAQDIFDETLSDSLTGSQAGGRAMVLWAKDKEGMAKIEAFPTNPLDKLFEQLLPALIDLIARITQVPTILANIQVSGKLGNSQEIINATSLLNNSVLREQNLISAILTKILALWETPKGEVVITPMNPVQVIPTEVWMALTREEQRQYISTNYPVDLKEEEAPPTTTLIEKIGIGGVQAMSGLLTQYGNQEITSEQLIAALKIVFGLTDEQARQIANVGPAN